MALWNFAKIRWQLTALLRAVSGGESICPAPAPPPPSGRLNLGPDCSALTNAAPGLGTKPEQRQGLNTSSREFQTSTEESFYRHLLGSSAAKPSERQPNQCRPIWKLNWFSFTNIYFWLDAFAASNCEDCWKCTWMLSQLSCDWLQRSDKRFERWHWC